MRKRIIDTDPGREAAVPEAGCLDLEALAEVEVTSEQATHPIEAALLAGRSSGWRAAGPGRQTIRLRFDRPQRLSRISLQFVEDQVARTQEYVLRWSADDGKSYRDIVRQQWNFSPGGATLESETHELNLPTVSVLELSIEPDIGGKQATASLQSLRLA